jgi:hypothetical protein
MSGGMIMRQIKPQVRLVATRKGRDGFEAIAEGVIVCEQER